MNISFSKSNIIVMLAVTLLFSASHYYLYTTSFDIFREGRLICSAAMLGLCVFGSIFLLADADSTRSRRVFALQMILIGLAAAFTLIRVVMRDGDPKASEFLVSPGVLIYGNIYAFIFLMYPFELLHPGRMTCWRYLKRLLPAILTGLFYYGYIRLNGITMTEINSWHDILSNLHKFDVWFRFTIFIYPVWMFLVILYQRKRYIDWCYKNFSNIGYIKLGWLNYYLFGYFLILISYMIVVLLHNNQSLLLHSLCILLFIGFSFYNILRQEAPVLSELSADDYPEGDSTPPSLPCDQRTNDMDAEASDDKYRFIDKVPFYKAELERWMLEQKPYHDKDFKLLDVMQVLPLNRSYISRLFNDGYGETFFCFVMRHRIDESVRLLERNPEMTIRRISDLCGFSSPSVFGRAFLKNRGVTPKQYRKDLDIEI